MVIVNHAFPKQTTFAATTVVKSNVSIKTYQIFYPLNCKTSYILYLLECLKCQMQYVGKSKTEFNITLNSYRKRVTRKDNTPVSNHLPLKGTILIRFKVTKQLNQANLDIVNLQKRSKIKENFWILEILYLNRELNKI